ncbi:hypothetical protein SKAU_G00223770 [Synaphobranchus kaupii]|uniref:Pre-B-cell leukemia transcription factor-interacting protein 1 n=1 Tax=Synaphobranchus kaupii TaxID=118154 RepID=A0A9Q1IU36_SYNKA|nr:hypothetical protein SKAU_G00223770 [Synaphobranchus kaupii]
MCMLKWVESTVLGQTTRGVMSESSNIADGNVPATEPAVGNVGPGAEGSESLTATPSLAQGEKEKRTEMLTGDSTAQTTEGVHSEQGLQKPAVENIGPGAEANEGFTDTPISAQEVTGAVTEAETGGSTGQTKGARSEEGLQVCQETVAEINQGSTPPSPTLLSPSPSSHISFGCNLEASAPVNHEPETFSDTYTHISSSPESHIPINPYPESDSRGRDGLQQEEEESELAKKVAEVGKQAELPYDSELGAEQGTEGEGLRKRKVFPIGPLDQLGREGDETDEDDQFRPREGDEDRGGFTLNKCILGVLLLLGMGTILFSGVFTDLDDEEDVNVRELSEKELHAAASQVLQNADTDPQTVPEMAELLDKLAKENQQISELQTQLQSQKEELNLALQQAEEKGRESVRKGELEKENERMKEELSSLPALQSELESLRARVTELTLITAKEDSQEPPVSASVSPPSDQNENDTQTPVVEEQGGAAEVKSDAGSLTEELERQKVLLEGSRKRLEGMKNEENRNGKAGVGEQKEKAKKDRHWQGAPDKTPLNPSHRHHEHNDYWKRKKEKLQHFYRPLVQCNGIAECAKMEGLAPVKLSDFEALLGGYLGTIEGAGLGDGEEISKLVKDFFVDGVFTHDKISFRDFVEDVADILEDMVEVEGEDNEELEDEMEEFEKDALRKFSANGGDEEDLRREWKRGNGRVRV